jgi:UDP-GlcNAc3NAcA epimerase
MKKIISILGARPQFIKAAVLSRIIHEKNEIEELIVHTGQHYDANMSEIFFSEMKIPPPKYNLAINGLQHGAMTGQMLEKIEEVLIMEDPDLVLVYGDTNTTLAGALAAKKLGIRVVHVEAGLRSFNMNMPEEVNRILTDRISDLLLCPTPGAVANLKAEGFESFDSKIVLSGDIMKESVSFYGRLSAAKSTILKELGLINKPFVLATIHRQENTSDLNRLKSILKGLNTISKDCLVVLPVHPRTRAVLETNKLEFEGLLVDPVGYYDMLEFLKHCSIVVTDSGGLQKEAFFNQKPCVVIRDETEWVELVAYGYAKLVGSDTSKIKKAYLDFIQNPPIYDKHIYGDNVGEAIYMEIKNLL